MKKQVFKRRLRWALSAIYMVAVCWWVSSTEGVRAAAIIIAIALVLGGALGFVALSFRLKRVFLQFFAPGSLRAGSADEFPQLDRAVWERVTGEWRELGFEPSVDRAVNAENPAFGQTFSRTLEHPAQGALAEISQQFTPGSVGPLTLSVVSFWGERAPIFQMAAQLQELQRAQAATIAPLAAPDGARWDVAGVSPALPDETELWLLMTHNRAPNKFWSLLRHKRFVSRRVRGEVTPRELWQLHLEQRALVEARLRLPHEVGELEPLIEAHSVVLSAQLRRRLRRVPAWKFGLARLSLAAPPANYDGELPV